MKTTQQLHALGQRLWLDNISRGLLTSGALRRYIGEFSITGLTSNPTIFDQAIRNARFYDDAIRRKTAKGKSGEALFLELALEDVTQAADLFRVSYDRTAGERRIAAGLDPKVNSVASIFVSRWDVAVKDKVPQALRNRLGIAIAMRTYKAYRDLLASPRWQKLAVSGALPQRLLWASTGTKDPEASDTLYIEALAAPDTINTMPEKTLLAFADHGKLKDVLPVDGGHADAVLAEFARAGIDDESLAADLQREGIEAFAKSWSDLMHCIASKSALLALANPVP